MLMFCFFINLSRCDWSSSYIIFIVLLSRLEEQLLNVILHKKKSICERKGTKGGGGYEAEQKIKIEIEIHRELVEVLVFHQAEDVLCNIWMAQINQATASIVLVYQYTHTHTPINIRKKKKARKCLLGVSHK
jgi:hypothetical protein